MTVHLCSEIFNPLQITEVKGVMLNCEYGLCFFLYDVFKNLPKKNENVTMKRNITESFITL